MINQHFKLKKTIPWRWARSWDTFLGQEPGENCDPVEGGNGITDVCAHLPLGFGRKNPRDRGIFPLVMTNSLPWFFDGPNRNRWFTFLKKMGGSFHGELVNFQLVTFFFVAPDLGGDVLLARDGDPLNLNLFKGIMGIFGENIYLNGETN